MPFSPKRFIPRLLSPRAIVPAVLLVLAAGPAHGAQTRDHRSGAAEDSNVCAEAVLFQHARMRGRRLAVTESIADLHARGFGDRASSLCVPRGWAVSLYEHTRYRGRVLVISGPRRIGNLHERSSRGRHWGDSVSSVKVDTGGGRGSRPGGSGVVTGTVITDHRDSGSAAPAARNRCVDDVEAQARRLASVKGRIVRHSKPRSDPALDWWRMLNDQRFNVCHIQGMAVLSGGAAEGVFAFTNNIWGRKKGFKCGGDEELNETGPVLFVSDRSRPRRFRTVEFWLRGFGSGAHPFGERYNWHPGGMQALGSYIFVGTDDGGDKGGNDSVVWIIDASDPGDPRRANQFFNDYSRAEAVAVERLEDGRIVVAIGSRRGEHLEVFVSEDADVASTGFHRAPVRWPGKYPGEADSNFNSYAFVRQCGDGKLYLAGLTNNDYRYGGGVPFDDRSHLHLYEAAVSGGAGSERFHFTRALGDRLKMHNPHGGKLDTDVSPNWSAGGTLWVNPDNRLVGYATEHVPGGGDLDVLSWTVPGPDIRDRRRESCAESIQGAIAWNYEGDRRWAARNLQRLCRGTPQSSEPGRCFAKVMHGGVDWGGGTRWQWRNAVDLCEGTRDAEATIACFERGIESGSGLRRAITDCGE